MWREFEIQSPDLAAYVRARFLAHPHHVMGTIDRSGAPRLSGINVFFNDGTLWFGSMPGARKTADIARDPRVSIHSATLSESLDGGDARISGFARGLDTETARAWNPDNPGDGEYFALDIQRVHLVEVRGKDLVVTMWDVERGLRSVERQ